MTQPVTLERAMGAAQDFYNARITARLQDSQGVPRAMEGALRDTLEHLLSPVVEFMRDVQTYFEGITGDAS